MKPEERKAIIERPWTYEEAREARECIQGLLTHGEWQAPPTEPMKAIAEALCSYPAGGALSQIQGKILDAFENRMARLEGCLRDYVEADDTNDEPGNEFWLDIKARAEAALKEG